LIISVAFISVNLFYSYLFCSGMILLFTMIRTNVLNCLFRPPPLREPQADAVWSVTDGEELRNKALQAANHRSKGADRLLSVASATVIVVSVPLLWQCSLPWQP
jgi:hypothetical protein